MDPAESIEIPVAPISTLTGEDTASPFLRFLKNTLAPAGTSGRAATVVIFIVECDVSVCVLVESEVTAVSLLVPELHDINPINKIAGMLRNFFIIFYF